MRKQKVAILLGVGSVVIAGVAVAATILSSSQVTSPNLSIDGSNATYATANVGSLSSCPSGFSFLGNRCMEPVSSVVFQANEIVGGFAGTGLACGGSVSFRHQAASGAGIPPSTHVFVRGRRTDNGAWLPWSYEGTVVAQPTALTESIPYYFSFIPIYEVQVLLGRAYSPTSSRGLRWVEVSATIDAGCL